MIAPGSRRCGRCWSPSPVAGRPWRPVWTPPRSVEQTLLAAPGRAARPEVFGAGRVFCMDRNFPGHEIINAIRGCGGHLIMRIKAGITLTLIDGCPTAPIWPGWARTIPARSASWSTTWTPLAESANCSAWPPRCWTTTPYPARAVAEVYPKRWTASETTIGENKTLITDAGPSRGPILRSGEPDLVLQEFYAWLAAGQLVRKAAHPPRQPPPAGRSTPRRCRSPRPATRSPGRSPRPWSPPRPASTP